MFSALPSIDSLNRMGPSAAGLKNKFFAGLYIDIVPVVLQIAIKYLSPLSIIDSVKKFTVPCDINESRSISPILNPPSFALPLTGCLVNWVLGPNAR